MRIAGIQISAGQDITHNISHAVELAGLAAEKGATVICFPELCLSPWFLNGEDKSHFTNAREATDNSLFPLKAISLETKTVIIVPFFESDGGSYYNSAAVFDSGA